MIDYKEILKNSTDRQRQQIAAGTHTTCPVCKQHVELQNGKIALHYDIMADDIDIPCKGSRKAVQQ